MPYNTELPTEECPICKENGANIAKQIQPTVDCIRCGDFRTDRALIGDWQSELRSDPKAKLIRALASHLIRRMQGRDRPYINADFFLGLRSRSLPRPREAADNLMLWIASELDGMPGNEVQFDRRTAFDLAAEIGAVDNDTLYWLASGLKEENLLHGGLNQYTFRGNPTFRGWEKIEDLRRSRTDSKFAFFARKFANPELDRVFKECLQPAVLQTGYELRTVSLRAGLIDAIIEDEIRRCRFMIADLSDDNPGAYWEAGFAEGLGKPVIYLCRERDGGIEKQTHFDTGHRQTVRWDLGSLDETAAKLKATIRNTLLSDAIQGE